MANLIDRLHKCADDAERVMRMDGRLTAADFARLDDVLACFEGDAMRLEALTMLIAARRAGTPGLPTADRLIRALSGFVSVAMRLRAVDALDAAGVPLPGSDAPFPVVARRQSPKPGSPNAMRTPSPLRFCETAPADDSQQQ
jgi:hypothetical protein